MDLYPETSWFGFNRLDETILFYNFVNSIIRPSSRVLDFGAGRAWFFENDECEFRRRLRSIKGKVDLVIGADIDDVVLTNKAVDRAFLLEAQGRIPLEDGSIDLILADWVFEHLAEPSVTVAEFTRVLKPGGMVCARTPNKNGYIALGARVIPERFHEGILALLQPHRREVDVFKKFYRLNKLKDFRRAFSADAYDIVAFCVDVEPRYAGRHLWLKRAFRIIDALTPEKLRPVWLFFAKKRL